MDIEREKRLQEAEAKLGINTKGQLLDPRFDYVFKRIFTAQEQESNIALIDFLNSILFNGESKIVDLTVINTEIPVEEYSQKKSRFDIRVVFNKGEQALIEMEFNPKDNFIKRSLHSVSSMYSAQPINRQDYRRLKKCYMVGVMGYNLLKKKNYDYINIFTFRDGKGRQLSGDVQITFVELEKTTDFLNKPVEELTNAECWGLFLRYASFDDKHDVLDKISDRQEGIKMAVDVLKYISKDTIERLRYEDEILAEIDIEARLDYKVKEIAKKMIAKNKPVDEIMEFTDLTEDEIEELKEELEYEAEEDDTDQS